MSVGAFVRARGRTGDDPLNWFSKIPHTCQICGAHKPDDYRSEKERKQRQVWGCDEQTETPQAGYECQRCSGTGHTPGGICPSCNGAAEILLHRCPNQLLDTGAMRVIEAFGMYRRDVTAITGGRSYMDLPATLVTAFRYLEGLYQRWEKYATKVAEEEARVKAERERKNRG